MSQRVATATPTCDHAQPAAHRAVLHQAVGVLMDWYDISPETAQDLVRTWATHCGASACQVAEGLVHGICLGKPTTCQDTLLRQLEQLLRHLPALNP